MKRFVTAALLLALCLSFVGCKSPTRNRPNYGWGNSRPMI